MSDPITMPQTEREIATTGDGRDITRGYTGALLLAQDTLLRTRGGGDLRLYESILSDPQVMSTFQQRRHAVTRCEWKVRPASDRRVDKQAAKALDDQLSRIGWDARTDRMLYGVFFGFAAAELIWERQGDLLGWRDIKVRDRRRFRFAPDGGLRLLLPTDMAAGVAADEPYFWHYSTGATHDDEPYGLGLGHWCYWPVLFKRNGIKFWLIACEKFGMPTAIGKYDAQALPAERTKLLQAVSAIQTDAGIIMPKDMEISLLEAARSGSADYKVLHDTMDETIAKVVLGQTASSQGTPGRLGNDDLQGDVRRDIVKADADLICESFCRGPATWFTRLNFPDADVPMLYRVVDEPEDIATKAETDTKIHALGFKPTLAYITETYGAGWEPQSAAPPDAAVQAAQFAEAVANDAPDLADDLAAVLIERGAPMTAQWIDQVKAVVDAAESYDDLLARLPALHAELPIDDLGALLQQALTTANLAGRDAVAIKDKTP